MHNNLYEINMIFIIEVLKMKIIDGEDHAWWEENAVLSHIYIYREREREGER